MVATTTRERILCAIHVADMAILRWNADPESVELQNMRDGKSSTPAQPYIGKAEEHYKPEAKID